MAWTSSAPTSLRWLLAAVITALFLAVPSSRVQAAPAPALVALEGLAFRNIVATGDMYVMLRFEMPLSDGTPSTSTAWCAELDNETGCTANPPAPDDPFSLPRGNAWVAYYTASRAFIHEQVIPPRVGFGLVGIYFAPGHGLTWQDTTAELCIQSASAPTYDAVVISCAALSWNGGATTAAAITSLQSNLVQQVTTLESERQLPPRSLVNGASKITYLGRPFALEALNVMDRIVPDAFQTGSGVVLGDYVAPSGDTALQTQVGGEAAATGLTAALSSVGLSFFGLSGPNAALFLFILPVGLLSAALAYGITRETSWAGIALVSWLIIGTWMRAPTVSVVMALLAVMAIGFSWWIVRKATG